MRRAIGPLLGGVVLGGLLLWLGKIERVRVELVELCLAPDGVTRARPLAEELAGLHLDGGSAALGLGALVLAGLLGRHLNTRIRREPHRGRCGHDVALGAAVGLAVVGGSALVYGWVLSSGLETLPWRGREPLFIEIEAALIDARALVEWLRWVVPVGLSLLFIMRMRTTQGDDIGWTELGAAALVLALGISAWGLTRGHALDAAHPLDITPQRTPTRHTADEALPRAFQCEEEVPRLCPMIALDGGPRLNGISMPAGDLAGHLEAARHNLTTLRPADPLCLVLEPTPGAPSRYTPLLRAAKQEGFDVIYLLAARPRQVHTATWGERTVYHECKLRFTLIDEGGVPLDAISDFQDLARRAERGALEVRVGPE